MNSLVLFILCAFQFNFALAGGSASDAGNGGGLAEKNVLFAYDHLHDFIDLCLNTSFCRTDALENKLLTEIKSSLITEQKSPPDFRSGVKAPNFFKIEGLIRVAKTGDNVGDPVFINQDLLYSKNSSGMPVAVDVPLSVSILVHELGHHHGTKDHNALDRLGAKMQTALLAHQERSEFWNGNAALTTYQLNSVRNDADKSKIHSFDQLILENGGELYNLTDALKSHFRCPNKKAPLGIRLYNISGQRGTHFEEKDNQLSKPFEGWFIQVCELGKEFDHGNFKIDLNFKKISADRFEFLPEKTNVKIITCKKNPEVCK